MRRSISLLCAGAAFLAGGAFFCAPHPAQAASANKEQVEQLEIQALDLEDKGDFEGACAKFRAAYALKPNDKALKQNFADALNSAGVTLFGNKDYAGASAHFTEALTLVPNFNVAKVNLGKVTSAQANIDGNALYKAGNVAAAKEKYATAAAADPSNISAKANLATTEADLLVTAGDLVGAVAKRQEALGYAPDNANLKQRLAEAQAALAAKQAEDAKKAAEEAKKNK
jgi:tetratricopeptide (TPR) repeat protein